MGWSAVGFATGWVTSYWQLFACRVLLGFFEAGHWPCALVTSQRLLSRRDRPLGNSILQSGASLGAIATPIVVLLLASDRAGELAASRSASSARSGSSGSSAGWRRSARRTWRSSRRRAGTGARRRIRPRRSTPGGPDVAADRCELVRRFLALAIVVIVINWCWQYFRAWMPGMLREQYGYGQTEVQYLLHRLLPGRGRRLPGGRVPGQVAGGPGLLGPRGADVDVFAFCTLLTAPEHAGRVPARLVAVPGRAAGRRVRLARPVPHVLRLHPGAVGEPAGTGSPAR